MKKLILKMIGLVLATSSFATVNTVKNENGAKEQLGVIVQNNATSEPINSEGPIIYFRSDANKGIFYDYKITDVIGSNLGNDVHFVNISDSRALQLNIDRHKMKLVQ